MRKFIKEDECDDPENDQPFMPYGYGGKKKSRNGTKKGIKRKSVRKAHMKRRKTRRRKSRKH